MEVNMKNHLIIAILNQGEGVHAMAMAKDAGAGGGTLLSARGTSSSEMVMFLGVTITPEKDMLMTVVEDDILEAVSNAIFRSAQLEKKGNGIIFTCPVEIYSPPKPSDN